MPQAFSSRLSVLNPIDDDDLKIAVDAYKCIYDLVLSIMLSVKDNLNVSEKGGSYI
jgi:hypothetical protein